MADIETNPGPQVEGAGLSRLERDEEELVAGWELERPHHLQVRARVSGRRCRSELMKLCGYEEAQRWRGGVSLSDEKLLDTLYTGQFRARYMTHLAARIAEVVDEVVPGLLPPGADDPAVPRTPADVTEDAWIGDAVHRLDLRRVILASATPLAERTIVQDRFLAAAAQRAFYAAYQGVKVPASGPSDHAQSTAFEASYQGRFRADYLEYLIGQLPAVRPFPPVARFLGREASLDITPDWSGKLVMPRGHRCADCRAEHVVRADDWELTETEMVRSIWYQNIMDAVPNGNLPRPTLKELEAWSRLWNVKRRSWTLPMLTMFLASYKARYGCPRDHCIIFEIIDGALSATSTATPPVGYGMGAYIKSSTGPLCHAGERLEEGGRIVISDSPLPLKRPVCGLGQPRGPAQSLLIATFGTHGDFIPMLYVARLAARQGVAVCLWRAHDMDQEGLERIGRGDLWSSYPDYAMLQTVPALGYMAALIPHVELNHPRVASYRLAPPDQYIDPIVFRREGEAVALQNLAVGWVAEFLTSGFRPTFQLGCLKGCNLPRSADGLEPLRRPPAVRGGTKPRETAAWVAGSARRGVIPEHIRDAHPEVTGRDHLSEFSRYKVIHCHGGAGTMQTALMAGCEVVAHDRVLDRRYRRPLRPSDLRQPGPDVFYGWLVASGFKLAARSRWRCWVDRARWHASNWRAVFSTFLTFVVRSLLLAHLIHQRGAVIAMGFLLLPCALQAALYRTVGWKTLAHVWGFVWRNPGLFQGSWLIFFATLLLGQNDFAGWLFTDAARAWKGVGGRYSIFYEPVSRGIVAFPFPYGHWGLISHTDDAIIEGAFVQGQSFGADFKLRRRPARPLRPGALVIPTTLLDLNPISGAGAPYSSRHNCVTILRQLVYGRSFLATATVLIVELLVSLALSPPDGLKRFIEALSGRRMDSTNPFYTMLGFAAGDGQVPLENVEEEVIRPLIAELLEVERMLVGSGACGEEDGRAALEATLLSELTKQAEKGLEEVVSGAEQTVPGWLVKNLTGAFRGEVRLIVDRFIAAYTLMAQRVATVPAVQGIFAGVALLASYTGLDGSSFGAQFGRRLKTVWGLTSLSSVTRLDPRARLALSVAEAEFGGRKAFSEDFESLVGSLTERSKFLKEHPEFVGGRQERLVRDGKPVMTEREAELMGLGPGDYVLPEGYDARVGSYIALGAQQGGDAVIYGALNPERIADSILRYSPREERLTSDDRVLCGQIADALFDKYPQVFANMQVTPIASVKNYLKAKYSPGVPFIKKASVLSTRKALWDVGVGQAIQELAQHYLRTGEYPVQFYHAFAKSQVVDLQALLPEEKGGKGKQVRTVVSQDLVSYFVDQVLQIERNKRNTWDTYGAGMGMPLNQTMKGIFDKLQAHHNAHGGAFVTLDATAYDGGIKPPLFEVTALLAEKGFADHESGNGRALASVLRAKYDAMQDAWILGITMPPPTTRAVVVADPALRDRLLAEDFLTSDTSAERALLVVPEFDGARSWAWRGEHKLGPANRPEPPPGVWHHDNYDDLVGALRAIYQSPVDWANNYYPKNRGGGTGQSATSWDNTVTFKAGLMWAWCKTTGRPPTEFFQENLLYNTSDDTVWHASKSSGVLTSEELVRFQAHAAEVGLVLKLDVIDDITKVEYLSKMIRRPTAFDEPALSSWRAGRIRALIKSGCLPDEARARITIPSHLVVHRPERIYHRRTAFRYYQAGEARYRYTAIERGAGHAYVTAFCPEVYLDFANEWVEDVNILCHQMKIHARYEVDSGPGRLPRVVQRDSRLAHQALSPRQSAFLKWLKGAQFPSYERVVEVHMRVRDPDPSAHQKFLAKLDRTWATWDVKIVTWYERITGFVYAIPEQLSSKLALGPDVLRAEAPFSARNGILERFVLQSMLRDSAPGDLDYSAFTARISESPYSCVANPLEFWEAEGQQSLERGFSPGEFHMARAAAAGMTITYWAMTILLSFMATTPVLRLVTMMNQAMAIQYPKLYGLANTLYWHLEGSSSREIARLVPRDPFLLQKRTTAFLLDFIPVIIWSPLIPVFLVLEGLGRAIEAGLALPMSMVEHRAAAEGVGASENPWSAVWVTVASQLTSHRRVTLASETATGKSTWFIAAAAKRLELAGARHIVHLVPRIILRQETEYPTPTSSQEVFGSLSPDFGVTVHRMTYGSFISRMPRYTEDTLVVFDEFHEQSPEMILVASKWPGPSIFMSATPVKLPFLGPVPMVVSPIGRRFPIEVVQTKGESVVDMFLRASRERPELMDRVLVIVPTYRQLDLVVETLRQMGWSVSELSRRRKTPQDTTVVVATPYVQTGLDLKHPPSLLIDSGVDVVFDKGKLVFPLPFTSRDVNKQRIGRVGRLKPGVVYQPARAGSGPESRPYPSLDYLRHKVISDHYGLPHLVPSQTPANTQLPYLEIPFFEHGMEMTSGLLVFYSLWFLEPDLKVVESAYVKFCRSRVIADEHHTLKVLHATGSILGPLPAFPLVLAAARTVGVDISTSGGVKRVNLPVLLSGRIEELGDQDNIKPAKDDLEEVLGVKGRLDKARYLASALRDRMAAGRIQAALSPL